MVTYENRVEMDVSVGQNVRIMMAKRNIRTIEELKTKSGLSRPTISKIMNNKTEYVALSTMVKLCHALECELSDIVKVHD